MRRLVAAALAATLGGAPLLAQQPVPPTPSDPVVAQRGSIALTASDVRDMVRFAEPDVRRQLESDPAALSRAVRERLIALSVLAEARAHQWDTRPDIAWRADRAREAVITDSYLASLTQPDPNYPSDEEVLAAYEANKAKLMLPRQYHLAQIYLAVSQDAPIAADTDAQKRLNELRSQVVVKHADFAALARRQSDDRSSAGNGGDLGWVREDQLLPAVRTAVAGMAEGAVSDPIHAADGWHLVRLLGTKPAGPAPLADIRDNLVRALRQQKQQENVRAYLAGMLKQQPIQINEIQLSGLLTK
jgi:hypothetical protein